MSEAAGSKRSNEGGNAWGGGKKARGDSVTLRFLLRSKHAGGIIGKGGETIKRLRTEFNASVTVPDTTTNERVLSIGAEKEDCVKVLRECLPLVHEPPYPVNAGQGRGGEEKPQSEFEIDFLVHSSQVGGIIGRAGSRIKQIREETSANVKVYQECLPDSTERVVAVGGSEDALIAALQQMLDVMQEQPIKGNITLYDPSYDHSQGGGGFDNYDGYNNNFNGPPRGGMGGGMRGNGGMRGGGRGGGRGGMGGMGGGGMGGPGGRGGGPGGNFGPGPQGGGFGGGNMGQQDFGGNNFGGGGDNFNGNYGNQGGAPQGGDNMFGAAGGNFNNGGAGGNFGAGGGNNNMPSTTTQVTVPNDMAGAIIGKGGERIRGIRQKCGADIKFSDSDPGKKDRLITISGSQDQIQYAQYLMQQCVRSNYQT